MADIINITKMELILEGIDRVSVANLSQELQQLGACDIQMQQRSLLVKYVSSEDAQQAIARFHGHYFEGTVLSVKPTEASNDIPKDPERSRSRSRSPRRFEQPEASAQEAAPAKHDDMPNPSPQSEEEIAEPSPDVAGSVPIEACEQESHAANLQDKQE